MLLIPLRPGYTRSGKYKYITPLCLVAFLSIVQAWQRMNILSRPFGPHLGNIAIS